MSWMKFAGRMERKWYQRLAPANNSFGMSNELNASQQPDKIKAGRAWLLLGWEASLVQNSGFVSQVDTAVHLCPPGSLPTVFTEGLLAVPSPDPGTMQLEFGNQTTSAGGGVGRIIMGSFLGSTTAKYPLVALENWFIASYFLSTSNGSIIGGSSIGNLKLLVIDLSFEELCEI